MALSDYVKAMPKVEINVHLSGAMRPETVAVIADQNEIGDHLKHFPVWMELLRKPDYTRLDDIIKMAASWLTTPDDLKYVVYELGTTLHKQNVRYAEISIDPTLYGVLALQPDEFLAVINDGRDRAERAWKIKLGWIISIPREEPRRAEDIVRWATSPSSRKAGVVGIGLIGRESIMPVGQFERPFKTAEKRDVARAVRAGEEYGAEGIVKAIEALAPSRIIDARGLAESNEAVAKMRENGAAACLSLARAVKHGWVADAASYPLRQLYDTGVPVVLSSDMPALYQSSLNDEYLTAVEQGLITIPELEEIALNAVRASNLEAAEKEAMIADFESAYRNLRGLAEV